LSFSARVAGGKLQLALGYSKALHGQATVQYLMDGYADELRALIEHCRQPDSGGYTPSDFKLAKVDQKLLDKLAAKLRNR
jgi:non-ribosomal peptide synthase protein (TIGR01720 family)